LVAACVARVHEFRLLETMTIGEPSVILAASGGAFGVRLLVSAFPFPLFIALSCVAELLQCAEGTYKFAPSVQLDHGTFNHRI
jgi:hypothetical protein